MIYECVSCLLIFRILECNSDSNEKSHGCRRVITQGCEEANSRSNDSNLIILKTCNFCSLLVWVSVNIVRTVNDLKSSILNCISQN